MQSWQEQPPSHLTELSVALPADDPRWPMLHQYGASLWALRCTCGSEQFKLRVHHDNEEDMLQPPIEMLCDRCSQRSLIFDPRQHGYEGQFGSIGDLWAPPDDIRIYTCSHCSADPFQAAYIVQSIELDDSDELPEASRPNDYFTWFALATRCSTCGQDEEIMSWECA